MKSFSTKELLVVFGSVINLGGIPITHGFTGHRSLPLQTTLSVLVAGAPGESGSASSTTAEIVAATAAIATRRMTLILNRPVGETATPVGAG